MTEKCIEELTSILDNCYAAVIDGDVARGMNSLVDRLGHLARDLTQEDFRLHAQPICLAHPMKSICHQDPYTRHSFLKPRGYAGDAMLIDFFYGHNGPTRQDTQLGAEIFTNLMPSPACESVRYRRALLGRMIDDVVSARLPKRAVLSIACGHLREISYSLAATSGEIESFHAFDHDRQTLAVVSDQYGEYGAKPVNAKITSIVSGKFHLSGLAFVYAAGLYDYLGLPMAQRLTKRMFDMLASGGKLLVANFSLNIRERGYMETFMDWFLTYRTEQQVEAFSAEIEPSAIAMKRIFLDPQSNIIYLEMQKA